jgi:hypothetical protein
MCHIWGWGRARQHSIKRAAKAERAEATFLSQCMSSCVSCHESGEVEESGDRSWSLFRKVESESAAHCHFEVGRWWS